MTKGIITMERIQAMWGEAYDEAFHNVITRADDEGIPSSEIEAWTEGYDRRFVIA